MPEIFTEDAEELLKATQRVINDAINELRAFMQYNEHAPGASGVAWMTDVHTKAAAAGVDLTGWFGNKRPEVI